MKNTSQFFTNIDLLNRPITDINDLLDEYNLNNANYNQDHLIQQRESLIYQLDFIIDGNSGARLTQKNLLDEINSSVSGKLKNDMLQYSNYKQAPEMIGSPHVGLLGGPGQKALRSKRYGNLPTRHCHKALSAGSLSLESQCSTAK